MRELKTPLPDDRKQEQEIVRECEEFRNVLMEIRGDARILHIIGNPPSVSTDQITQAPLTPKTLKIKRNNARKPPPPHKSEKQTELEHQCRNPNNRNNSE